MNFSRKSMADFGRRIYPHLEPGGVPAWEKGLLDGKTDTGKVKSMAEIGSVLYPGLESGGGGNAANNVVQNGITDAIRNRISSWLSSSKAPSSDIDAITGAAPSNKTGAGAENAAQGTTDNADKGKSGVSGEVQKNSSGGDEN